MEALVTGPGQDALALLVQHERGIRAKHAGVEARVRDGLARRLPKLPSLPQGIQAACVSEAAPDEKECPRRHVPRAECSPPLELPARLRIERDEQAARRALLGLFVRLKTNIETARDKVTTAASDGGEVERYRAQTDCCRQRHFLKRAQEDAQLLGDPQYTGPLFLGGSGGRGPRYRRTLHSVEVQYHEVATKTANAEGWARAKLALCKDEDLHRTEVRCSEAEIAQHYPTTAETLKREHISYQWYSGLVAMVLHFVDGLAPLGLSFLASQETAVRKRLWREMSHGRDKLLLQETYVAQHRALEGLPRVERSLRQAIAKDERSEWGKVVSQWVQVLNCETRGLVARERAQRNRIRAEEERAREMVKAARLQSLEEVHRERIAKGEGETRRDFERDVRHTTEMASLELAESIARYHVLTDLNRVSRAMVVRQCLATRPFITLPALEIPRMALEDHDAALPSIRMAALLAAPARDVGYEVVRRTEITRDERKERRGIERLAQGELWSMAMQVEYPHRHPAPYLHLVHLLASGGDGVDPGSLNSFVVDWHLHNAPIAPPTLQPLALLCEGKDRLPALRLVVASAFDPLRLLLPTAGPHLAELLTSEGVVTHMPSDSGAALPSSRGVGLSHLFLAADSSNHHFLDLLAAATSRHHVLRDPTVLQRVGRGFLARSEAAVLLSRSLRTMAAVRIQSLHRGVSARGRSARLRIERERAEIDAAHSKCTLGTWVEAKGLSKHPELNGCRGRVVRWSGREVVVTFVHHGIKALDLKNIIY
eukprot:Sspe_Gene.96313::Locus_68939_Transcript_1_1_Confidence_1.000_Length_2384::g.96313::m.96313